jgi:hypothetical protein
MTLVPLQWLYILKATYFPKNNKVNGKKKRPNFRNVNNI